MEVCFCPREAKQLEKYERLLDLVSIDTTQRLLVTSPRGGMQGMRAKCGKRPHRLQPAGQAGPPDLLAPNFIFFACHYTLSRAYITLSRAEVTSSPVP